MNMKLVTQALLAWGKIVPKGFAKQLSSVGDNLLAALVRKHSSEQV